MRPILIALLMIIATPHARAQAIDAEAKAIRDTALDYVEGWYEGSVERMTRALHPELVKRIVMNDKGVRRT